MLAGNGEERARQVRIGADGPSITSHPSVVTRFQSIPVGTLFCICKRSHRYGSQRNARIDGNSSFVMVVTLSLSHFH